MSKSSKDFLLNIISHIRQEIPNHIDDETIQGILFSAHERKECNLSGKEISGETLTFLLASPHINQAVNGFGVRVIGLTVNGKLDLDSVTMDFPLVFKECMFNDSIVLRDAHTKYLSFEGSKCKYINASRITVIGSLWINRGFHASRGIELNNSRIRGNLDLRGATIDPIQENTFYRGKSLVLDCASIAGNLLGNPWPLSKVESKPFVSRGEISLVGATIKGSVIYHGAQLSADDQFIDGDHGKLLSLNANSMIVFGGVEFSKNFNAIGQILLMNMKVHGDLKCDGGKFHSYSSPLNCGIKADTYVHAISFDRSIIGGSLFLRDGFEATGQVRLIGTTINNDLDCSGGSFILSQHATVNYTMLLARSIIKGQAIFSGTQPDREGRYPFKTDGLIFLDSVQVGDYLDVTKGVVFAKNDSFKEFENGFKAINCVVRGWITFNDVMANDRTVIDLSGSVSGGLNHCWNRFLPPPQQINKLLMAEFIYNKYENTDDGRDKPREWLELYKCPPSCYQQLATALSEGGNRRAAVEILIDMEEKKLRSILGKFLPWLLKHGIGFGYRPQNALLWAFIFIFIGSLIFWVGDTQKVFYPVGDKAKKEYINGTEPILYPSFNSFAFSMETFFPVLGIDFGVKENWRINDKAKSSTGPIKSVGTAIYYYSWLHKLFGWIISTLIVGGFTAYFVRK